MVRTSGDEYLSSIFDSSVSAKVVVHTLVQLLQKLQLPVSESLVGSSLLLGDSPLVEAKVEVPTEEPAVVESALMDVEVTVAGEEGAGAPAS